jgi:MoaA/NifB/PqqE/SkfB family radical SAM enzyme
MRFLKPKAYLPTIRGLAANAVRRKAVYPFYASFKLTSRCHFGCPFCNVRNEPVPDLSTDQVKAILDNLSRSPVLLTSFEGGEPLLRKDIGELLAYARTKSFYLLFTTSVRNLLSYPLAEYAKYIDFFHVSIDEGHNNLDLFNSLPELVKLPTHVSVQSVVTADTLPALESKVRRCFEVGANIVVIPAAHMDGTDDYFPDIGAFERTLLGLRKRYPNTIHTPQGFFKAFREGRCSPASVIIAPDGRLYYPCHILNSKGPDLTTTDMSTWLRSGEASDFRLQMASCKRNCGWYQYYSIASYTSIGSVWEALAPVFGTKRRSETGVHSS